jgi:hypothetical protein
VAKTIRENVVSLFASDDTEVADIPMTPLRQEAAQSSATETASGIDLTGRNKVLMTFGAGRSGKTLMLRYLVERAMNRGGNPLTLATADAARPALKLFFPDAIGPSSVDKTTAWLETLFSRLMKSPRTILVDFGADMTLAPILAQVPTLSETMEEAGLSPVALYMLTPRSLDLTVLDAMEHVRFQPKATALVLNIGCTVTQDPEREFAQIRKHATYRAALDRGAVELWMPKLWSAKAIEDRLMPLYKAVEAEGGLDLFDRSRAYHWLAAMETALSGISTWLPPS